MFARFSRSCKILAPALLAAALLSGCAAFDANQQYAYQAYDPAKGVVVGSVFERAVFETNGATFTIETPEHQLITLSSQAHGGNEAIVNNPPVVPKGAGSTFALQLAPGRYRIVTWSLHYGSGDTHAAAPKSPQEFEVVAGKVTYVGRLDANRFLEIASLHDNLAEDLPHLKQLPLLHDANIENHALALQGWWMPNAAGIRMLKALGKPDDCEQCK